MIRLDSFDSLNPHKRAILKILQDREFNLREVTEAVGKSRSTNWHALKVLSKVDLIVPTKRTSKRLLKPHWSEKVKKLNRDLVRYALTENGRYALEYYKNFDGSEKNESKK
jgi:DNA-binding transcriptional ArsR family regulator